MNDWLIRYEYPGTIAGEPVGECYVTGPHFGTGVWSHAYDPEEAATWPSEKSAWRELTRHSWPNAKPVPRSEAKRLGMVIVETEEKAQAEA